MLRYRAQLFGEELPAEPAYIAQNKVLEIIKQRNAAELNILRGLKEAQAKIAEMSVKEMPDDKRKFYDSVFKMKPQFFSYLVEDLIWFESAGELEWELTLEQMGKTMMTAQHDPKFKEMMTEHNKAKMEYV